AACALRRSTSGAFGQAGLLAVAEPRCSGGGSERPDGRTSGARSWELIVSSPSRRKPRPSIKLRKKFWSAGRAPSVDCARAGPGQISAAAPRTRPKAALAPKTRVMLIVFNRIRTMEPLELSRLLRRIRALLRRGPLQESHTTGQ